MSDQPTTTEASPALVSPEQAAKALAALPLEIRATRATQFADNMRWAALYERKGFHRLAVRARESAVAALRPLKSSPCLMCDLPTPAHRARVMGDGKIGAICEHCEDETREFAMSLVFERIRP